MTHSPGWLTAIDLDFSAQSNQTFSSDGTYTINGLTWTKGNSSNESAHAAIVNGTGLNFQPSSGTDYNGSTRTIPYLWLPFTQIFPTAIDYDTKIRFYVSMGTDNSATTYDNEVFGYDTNNTNFYWVIKRGYGTSGQGTQHLMSVNGNNNNNFVNDSFTVASNASAGKTICLQIDNQLFRTATYFRTTSVAVGAQIPALGSYQPINQTIFGVSGGSPATVWSGVTLTNSSLGIVLGAQRAGSGTSLSVNYQRIRVDYKL